jgi:mannose-6-phosphate isomerase-like protein (cupin superfamily)
MPKASKESASQTEKVEGYEGHFEQVDDGYTIAFETYTEDNDFSPYFDGLPNNQCQAAHWGYVIKGKVAYDFGDHEETFETGDAYYVPPGHTPKIFAGTEVVEFSPTEELQETIEVVTKNMEKAGAGA